MSLTTADAEIVIQKAPEILPEGVTKPCIISGIGLQSLLDEFRSSLQDQGDGPFPDPGWSSPVQRKVGRLPKDPRAASFPFQLPCSLRLSQGKRPHQTPSGSTKNLPGASQTDHRQKQKQALSRSLVSVIGTDQNGAIYVDIAQCHQ